MTNTPEGWAKEFEKKFVVKSNAGTDLLRYTDANLIKQFINSELESYKEKLRKEVEGYFSKLGATEITHCIYQEVKKDVLNIIK